MKARIPAQLTVSQKQALDREIIRQLAEHVRNHEADYIAMALYAVHVELGFGKKRLERIMKKMRELHKELIDYYDMPHEGMYIARQKLLAMGIDTTPSSDAMIDYGFKR
jgi:hypothetical protein